MSMPEATAGATIPDPLVGQVLSERYRIDAVLGVGGMGAVYQGEHLLMHKRVAIKLLHPEMTRLPEAVQRFEREAMAAGHIEHPNVATAYDFGKLESGSFFLVLEFVEGQSLRDRLLQNGPLPVEQAVHITRQILQGLIRAHGLGIVHRDLKPDNVMLVERDGDPDFVKVLDFGIAKVPMGQMGTSTPSAPNTAALTQLGMVYGTPEYMAPEQALGQEVDHRADLYALGVMVYEMLAGRRPFDADSPIKILGMVVSMPVPTFAEIAPSRAIPASIEDVVRRLLSKVPDERFPDARSALVALDGACPPVPLSHLGGSGSWGAATGSSPSLTGHGAVTAVGAPTPSLLGATAPNVPGAIVVAPAPSPSDRARRVLIGIGAAAALGVALGGAAFWGRMSATRGNGLAASASVSATTSASAEPPSPPEPAVSADDIKQASAKGLEALEALRTKAPRDVRVLTALLDAQADARRSEAALQTLGDLAEIDATAMLDRSVRTSVAQLAIVDKKPDTVLAAAEKVMGQGYPDVLYELTLTPRASAALRKRANELLAKATDRTSPALRVALNLRRTTSVGKTKICGQAGALRPLYDEAREHGDSRALPFLLVLTDSSRSCGPFYRKVDCYACVRSEGLSEAIAAIRGREKSP